MPTIIIIFGATGDLMAKKIAPALFHLFIKGKLSGQTKIVGFSRRDWSQEQFRDHVRKILTQHGGDFFDKKQTESFLNLLFFQKGFFDKPADYKNLANFLLKTDQEWQTCSNKLFYLAVPPQFYESIFKSLDSSSLNIPCASTPLEIEQSEESLTGWTRLIVEKPFGQNLKTARQLDGLLRKFFQEEQIYRIDHYLAKEVLRDILNFRLTNNLFQNNWNNKVIKKIEIKLWETIGVEDRGNFYDDVGSLRDVGQNHLLQMLALVIMDQPKNLTADNIRIQRAAAIQQITVNNSWRAQYDSYQKIKGVKPKSQTETYFKVELTLNSDQWRGVPVILESGKRLAEVKKEIVITFKNFQNKIIFSLEPEDGIKIISENGAFYFRLRDAAKVRRQYVEEYEKLLLDCIIGDQTLFVSTEEIEKMWSVIDPIIVDWQKNLTPLLKYKPDTNPLLSENNKKIGIIGLGKMGGNIARRLIDQGWSVVGFNRTHETTKNLSKENLIPAYSIKELIDKLPSPKIIWLMLPAGEATDEMLFGKEYGLISFLKKGDTVVEGGNSFYEDSIRRAKKLKENGINFIDVGVSGGPSGALNGPALMIGGDSDTFHKIEFLFKDLARENGYQFFTGAGAGHFVKMIHNGIEYGMMQSLAEGFNILKKSSYSLDLKKVADIYNNGSVIESRLVGWMEKSLNLHGEEMVDVSGSVKHTGEGEWTVKTAKKMKLKAKIIEESFKFRVASAKNPSYTGKILSALREQFGGHSVRSYESTNSTKVRKSN